MNKLDEILYNLRNEVVGGLYHLTDKEKKESEVCVDKAKQAIIELIEGEIKEELDYEEEKYMFCSKCEIEVDSPYCPDCGRKSVERTRNSLEYSGKNCVLRDFAQKLQKLKE